tara:strand:- start:855 stop:1574 length:720 start_codon:yes stop_codon:yes gene_type:complete
MTKKALNQNSKYTQKLIDIIEPDYIFSNKPINRFKNQNNFNELENNNKKGKIKQLKDQIFSIQNCKIKSSSKDLVMGDGNLDSPLMVIGGAPGYEEIKSGLTFQGEVGVLLNKMLSAINIKIKNIYKTYAVNFRPPEDRKPNSQEIKRYSVFLKEHISIINPKILILLGSTAMEAIASSSTKVSEERGEWKEIIMKNNTISYMITFSPSYLIRFPDNKKYSWKDLKKIKQKIKDLNIEI